jgi:hypothetical protein
MSEDMPRRQLAAHSQPAPGDASIRYANGRVKRAFNLAAGVALSIVTASSRRAGALTESALVMTDSGGLALSDFAKSSGRRFLMFREVPADHWAPRSVLGVSMHVAT